MFFRLNDYKVLFYRIFLAYIFYSIARVLFYFYNSDIIIVSGINEFIELCLIGLTFDSSAILYTNAIFIVISLLPFRFISKTSFQKKLFLLYFFFNAVAYATNFFDFIYYRFSQSRLTTTIFNIVENETNKLDLLSSFIISYWHVFLLYFFLMTLWFVFYRMVKIKPLVIQPSKLQYFFSFLWFLFFIFVSIVGMRGGLGNATRPINMVDAHRYVKKTFHADLVLNSPFCLIRTYNKNFFVKENFMSKAELKDIINPVRVLNDSIKTRPNVMLIVLESFGREYIGAFNENKNIKNYKSYTPFLDSISKNSLIFTNTFANGRQSIEALPAILASIPSFRVPYTSSPFSNQKIQSLVSVFNEMNYETSFFHGAPNGSMGFTGLSNIMGFDNYYGKNEFNDDSLYDGYWGIWDEPFFQFTKSKIDGMRKPFFATLFSLSSHEPFKVPKNYKNKYPTGEIDMHQVVGYTDDALRKFFNSAKNQNWFENTLFVITADHCNQFYYPYYRAPINRYAIPLIFYKPDGSIKGSDNKLAQQLDIFPTIVDYIGYDDEINSWGNSLLDDKKLNRYSIHYSGTIYRFAMNDYILEFDGKRVVGVYKKNDYLLSENILNQTGVDFSFEEKYIKALLQDYMERVVDRKLN